MQLPAISPPLNGSASANERIIKIVLDIESDFTPVIQGRPRADSDEAFSFSHASGSRRGTIPKSRPTIVNAQDFFRNDEGEQDQKLEDDSDDSFEGLDDVLADFGEGDE